MSCDTTTSVFVYPSRYSVNYSTAGKSCNIFKKIKYKNLYIKIKQSKNIKIVWKFIDHIYISRKHIIVASDINENLNNIQKTPKITNVFDEISMVITAFRYSIGITQW